MLILHFWIGLYNFVSIQNFARVCYSLYQSSWVISLVRYAGVKSPICQPLGLHIVTSLHQVKYGTQADMVNGMPLRLSCNNPLGPSGQRHTCKRNASYCEKFHQVDTKTVLITLIQRKITYCLSTFRLHVGSLHQD